MRLPRVHGAYMLLLSRPSLEIHQAYRASAKRSHPDLSDRHENAEFLKVKVAYDTRCRASGAHSSVPNRVFSDSARVGWANIPSRSPV